MTTERGESRRIRCFGLCAGARNTCETASGRGSCRVRSTELESPVRLSLRALLLAFPDNDHAIELVPGAPREGADGRGVHFAHRRTC